MIDEVTQALIWKDVLALSSAIVRVCEQFTLSDGNVLVYHLRESTVSVPSSIAADLLAHRDATMEPLVRLATELELVRKIYPAIDIDDATKCLETVHTRIAEGKFAEQPAPPPEVEETHEEGQRPAEQQEFVPSTDNHQEQ